MVRRWITPYYMTIVGKRCLLIVLFVGYCCSSFAQDSKLRAIHWYFGSQYGLDFGNGTPEADNTSSIQTFESSCTMSGKNGELLFYTNGGGREDGSNRGYIWNRNHQPMEGGDLGGILGGGTSAAQGCITFKKPGTEDTYYLFTVDEYETLSIPESTLPMGKGCNYFEINMAANGGLGRVEQSNINLLSPSFEYISATLHANCKDYWLIVMTGHHAINNDPDVPDSFYVFQVTENGVQAPIKTPLPQGEEGLDDEYGIIKIAPDGSRLFCGAFLYDFDNQAGVISNPLNMNTELIAGLEDPLAFSPNSQYLYRFRRENLDTMANIYVLQYDLYAADIAASAILLDQTQFQQVVVFGTPQLAPDGRLYLPVQPNAYNFPTFVSVVQQPNVRGQGANFIPNDFTITKGQKDRRFLSFGNFTDHIFAYQPVLPVDLGPDQAFDCQDSIHQVLRAPAGMDCYLWSDGSTADTLLATAPGDYWVEVFSNCEMGGDSVVLSYMDEELDFDLGPDTALCEGEMLLLAPALPAEARLYWSDGSLAPALLIDSAGWYALEVELDYCFKEDSLEVSYNPLPIAPPFAPDTSICLGERLLLDAQAELADAYLWQNGSNTPIYVVDQAGTYSVTISNACGDVTASSSVAIETCDPEPPLCQLYIPNIFTPNDDGSNDDFRVFSRCEVQDFVLHIFDRWGEEVFSTQDISQVWDGRFRGQGSPSGVYAYLIQYT
ncbi:MAG: gliding motility-associated C-terminal domain-containing protein, partial [Bacteroidota bacterium]